MMSITYTATLWQEREAWPLDKQWQKMRLILEYELHLETVKMNVNDG